MKQFKKPGEKFYFLGTEMISLGTLLINGIPTVKARYKDNNGIIQNTSFGCREFTAIDAENKPLNKEER